LPKGAKNGTLFFTKKCKWLTRSNWTIKIQRLKIAIWRLLHFVTAKVQFTILQLTQKSHEVFYLAAGALHPKTQVV
jgi:hypothetical protein